MAATNGGRSNYERDERLGGEVREAVETAGTWRFLIGRVRLVVVAMIHARSPFLGVSAR
jgi:hypothetical protein